MFRTNFTRRQAIAGLTTTAALPLSSAAAPALGQSSSPAGEAQETEPPSSVEESVLAREAAAGVVPTNVHYPEFDIRRYGADMTGATASDTAWANWLKVLYSNRTNPVGFSGYGLGVATLPKGKIKLTKGYVAPSSAIGLIIRGAGQDATAIEYHNDSEPFYRQTTYVNFGFEDLSIYHVPVSRVRAGWSNCAIELSPRGGGRKFFMNRVRIYNFQDGVRILAKVNGDTNHIEHCEFYDNVRSNIWTRNPQAVDNTIINCTSAGRTAAFLDYCGFGHTTVIDLNAILDGVILRPFGCVGGFSGSSQFTIINSKGEPRNFARTPGSRSGIIRPYAPGSGSTGVPRTDEEDFGTQAAADWSTFRGIIHFINLGYRSTAYSYERGYYQIETNSGFDILFEGGHIRSDSLIKTRSADLPGRYRGIHFDGLHECPLPSAVARDDSVAGSQPSITWTDCMNSQSAGRVPNITTGYAAGSRAPVTLNKASHINHITPPHSSFTQAVVATNGTIKMELPFYGSPQLIEEVSVELNAKTGGSLKVDIYLDSARSALIESLSFTSADNGILPRPRKATKAADRTTTEGIYLTVTGDSTHYGYITAKHRAR